MTHPESTDGADRATRRVSDAMGKARGERGPAGTLLAFWRWTLVDAPRGLVVAILAVAVFVATIGIGLFGPTSVEAFLLEGTPIADGYIEIQTGIVTIVTLVLTVNQLILSPDIGPVSRQRQRLTDVIELRSTVEDEVGAEITPTEPSEFLRTVSVAIRERASALEAMLDDAAEETLRRRGKRYAGELVAEAERVRDALDSSGFGKVSMQGAAMHHDTTKSISEARFLLNEFSASLSDEAEDELTDLLQVLELFTVSREYFRTLYLRSEFIKFSRAILYTGIPAFVVAHFAIGIIGPGVLAGQTLGVLDLLWFEAAVFTIATLPLLVIGAFVARLVTLAESSIFIGSFIPSRDETV